MRNLIIVALSIVAVAATGCDTVADVTNKQSDAVKAAVSDTCDRYDECGQIGRDKSYKDRAECENHSKDFWNKQWPAAKCEGHINGQALTTCTDRIASTACDSFVDKLNTAYVTCDVDDVCR